VCSSDLDVLLVGRFGMAGAVAAAVAAYGVGALVMAVVARRALPGWRWASAAPALLLALGGGVLASLVRLPDTARPSLVAFALVAVVALYSALGLVLRAVRREDFALLAAAVATGARRLQR